MQRREQKGCGEEKLYFGATVNTHLFLLLVHDHLVVSGNPGLKAGFVRLAQVDVFYLVLRLTVRFIFSWTRSIFTRKVHTLRGKATKVDALVEDTSIGISLKWRNVT